MAFDTDTLEPYHDFTLLGRLNYEEMLDYDWDDGMFPYEHPIEYLIEKIQQWKIDYRNFRYSKNNETEKF